MHICTYIRTYVHNNDCKQVTEELQSSGREKSSVIDKLAVLQEERRKLIDTVTDKDKKIKELAKVITLGLKETMGNLRVKG